MINAAVAPKINTKIVNKKFLIKFGMKDSCKSKWEEVNKGTENSIKLINKVIRLRIRPHFAMLFFGFSVIFLPQSCTKYYQIVANIELV